MHMTLSCLFKELSTHIFFDVLGFDSFKGVVCRIQRSKHKTARKHKQACN